MPAFTLVDFTDHKRGLRWLMNQDLPFEAEKFTKATPKVPGVYRMLNSKLKVLYVGKAKILPKRFSVYFEGSSHRPDLEPEIRHMQTVYLFQDSEAQELEYSIYLKYYLPYYNKTTPDNSKYISLTNDHELESILPQGQYRRDVQSTPDPDAVKFIGPFTATRVYQDIIEELIQFFKLPTCTNSKFKRHQRQGITCEEYEFERCKGWCVKNLNYKEYWQPIRELVLQESPIGKQLLEEYREQLPVTAAAIGTRSILDTLNLRDEFEVMYLHRDEQIACMSVIEVSKGVVIDIRNIVLAPANATTSVATLKQKLSEFSNADLYESFLEQYYGIVRQPSYIADNDMIKHNPDKIILLNSGFNQEQAKQMRAKISEAFGYKVNLGARCNYPGLVNLVKYNARLASLQRLALLDVDVKIPDLTEIAGEMKLKQKLAKAELARKELQDLPTPGKVDSATIPRYSSRRLKTIAKSGSGSASLAGIRQQRKGGR